MPSRLLSSILLVSLYCANAFLPLNKASGHGQVRARVPLVKASTTENPYTVGMEVTLSNKRRLIYGGLATLDYLFKFWNIDKSLSALKSAEEREEGTMFKSPMFRFLDFMIGIPIIHDVMFGVYRSQIVEKSEKMGLDWTGFMKEQMDELDELKEIAKNIRSPEITIPQYYYAPIHAYKEGNLCWESAMEEDLWSKLMIAPLYNGALDGDVQMRQEWLAITSRSIKPNPKTATDLGCGTGLSMYMLDSKWPTIDKITGVDLSTYKLAIAVNKKNFMQESKANKYNLIHGEAESTPVESNSQDLVSLCLVAHESPKEVSTNIFAEAFRILKPGGSFTMLDLDKDNLEILLANPFVAAIYKRTEPYMSEFFTLDPMRDLTAAGFEVVDVGQASRSHRVYVARKPEVSVV